MRLKLVALTLVLCAFVSAQETPKKSASDPSTQPTPEMFWKALETGNKEFVAGKLAYPNLKAERDMFKESQYPPMTILSCSDSRVPVELVFNQSIGSLFVVRAAGNIADTFGLASMEFAISKGWTMLIVVLAHEDCGAIEASMGIGDPGSPHLLALANRIRGSFYGIDWDPKDKEMMKKATIANARYSAAYLLAQSPMIRQAVADGRVKIVVAYYSMDGKVTRVD